MATSPTPRRHQDFVAAGFFALRTPLLSFDDLLAWSEGLEAPALLDRPERLPEALAADHSRLRARLHAAMIRPEVREALFIASPHLEESFGIWEREPESRRGQGIELALVRYFARMAGRATPFGLCAGCSFGSIGSQTRFILMERCQNQRHTRLDMDYVQTLCEALARDSALRPLLVYRPNTSLYRTAGRLRYVESRIEEQKRTYHLVAVEETEFLLQTLARAAAGASSDALTSALVDDEISCQDAAHFIHELIDSQILVSDLLPAMTGPEPIGLLIDELQKHPRLTEEAGALREVRMELAAMDEGGPGILPERYRAAAQMLERLPAKVEISRLFQVDMVKPAAEATLGEAVLDEIMRGVDLFRRLAAPADVLQEELVSFRQAFVARYEGREVPLVEALDAENGVGFPPSNGAQIDGSPLLRGLDFPSAERDSVRWGKIEKLLLRKLGTALQNGALEIALQPGDVEKMSAAEAPRLPEAFSILATVAAASEASLATGDFQVFLQGATGPSGARFLGRFCHADNKLRAAVEGHLRAEEALRPGAIFAELVHLPEGRLGNVLARPILRAHEIPYLSRGSVATACQISVADLLIAVDENRIVLRSARLGCEVIPRLTSALDFHGRTVGIPQFLCLLQGQGVAENLGWRWGALHHSPFLPRVTMGRLVLSRARWRVEKDELKHLAAARGAARFRAVDLWRRKRRLPRLVALAQEDNALPIDFHNVLSIETFVSLSKSQEEVVLVEMFPGPNELCVSGPEGRFVHELIVPFVRKPETGADVPPLAPVSRASEQTTKMAARTFAPGSEWVYAKIYCGPANADRILRETIGPLVKHLLHAGAADRWFFIRYGDPDWHLRLRLHGTNDRTNSEVVPAVQAAIAPLLEDGRIWRLQFDAYQREVERYGGTVGVWWAEKIFEADSEAVLEIMESLEAGDAGLDERWRLALRGIDLLLKDFGFDPPAKLALLRKLRKSFAREFKAEANFKGQIGDRFRKERKDLEALLDSAYDASSPLSAGFDILQRRSARIATLSAALKKRERQLTMPLLEVVPSFLHLHVNRILRSAHRAHELVLYDFLARLYDGEIARERA